MRRLSSEHVDTQYFKAFLGMLSFFADFTADAIGPMVKKVSRNS